MNSRPAMLRAFVAVAVATFAASCLGQVPLKSPHPVIVAVRYDNNTIGLAVLDLASQALSKFEVRGCTDSHPAWAPDYRTIVFASNCDTKPAKFAESANIYLMNADGGNRKQLTGGRVVISTPDGPGRAPVSRFKPTEKVQTRSM